MGAKGISGNFVEGNVPLTVYGAADEEMVMVEPAHDFFLHSRISVQGGHGSGLIA